MFVRVKHIAGHDYYYLVENKRYGRLVKQRVISYLGKSVPPGLLEEISRKPLPLGVCLSNGRLAAS